jgi:hypothetical protein
MKDLKKQWRRYEPITVWILVRCISCEPKIMVSAEQEVGWIKRATLPASSVFLHLCMTCGIDPPCAHVTYPSWDVRWTRISKFNISVQLSGQCKRESLQASLFAEQWNNGTHHLWNPTLSPLKYYQSANPGILVRYVARTDLIQCRKQWICNHNRLTVFWKNKSRPVSSPCYLCIPLNFLSLWDHLAGSESPP